jgi:hypothetical protein
VFCGCRWYGDINRISSGYRRCRRNAPRMPDARVAQARVQKHDQLLPGRPVADGLWCRTLHWVCSDSDSVLGRYGDPLIGSMGAGLDAEARSALFVASDLSRHRRNRSTPSCLPERMKNKLSIASGGDTEVGKEITHADANIFIVMVNSHRMGGSCLWLRLSAGCE